MFLGQSFQSADLLSVAFLFLLEGLLSADNAIVLALLVRHLPPQSQRKGLLYGLVGAFAFRLAAILLASFVLRLWWLQAAGALYLLSMPVKHFLGRGSRRTGPDTSGRGLLATVAVVELMDIAFAIDSVLAGVTFVGNRFEKLWVVYLGAMLGIVLLRFAAGAMVRVLERYPVLDHVAYVLVGWVGVKLTFLAAHNYDVTVGIPYVDVQEMPHLVFWAVLTAIFAVGAWLALRAPQPRRN